MQPLMDPVPFETRLWSPLFPANIKQEERPWINKAVKVTAWYINFNKVMAGGFCPQAWGYCVELMRTIPEEELLKPKKANQ